MFESGGQMIDFDQFQDDGAFPEHEETNDESFGNSKEKQISS